MITKLLLKDSVKTSKKILPARIGNYFNGQSYSSELKAEQSRLYYVYRHALLALRIPEGQVLAFLDSARNLTTWSSYQSACFNYFSVTE